MLREQVEPTQRGAVVERVAQVELSRRHLVRSAREEEDGLQLYLQELVHGQQAGEEATLREEVEHEPRARKDEARALHDRVPLLHPHPHGGSPRYLLSSYFPNS